jgi:hypothetical protein
MAVTAQLEFTEDELLANADVKEPLIAGGVRCHGGFADDGTYLSPRTKFRVPAIEAWRAHHADVFAKPVIDAPMELWGHHFPNVDQARYLISVGVPEPLIATLTRIGTVEGYGANIRNLKPSNLQRFFDEDIRGTAVDHLGAGLFEAHGRDEAGWELEAGHKDMWFAARDIAFEDRSADVDIEAMLGRMGFGPQGRDASEVVRLLPADIDVQLEFMVALMIRVMFIEISAFHTFRWAEAWLSDPDLVAGDGAAGRLVSYIRADETPHVAYLATALTEVRDRTWIGDGGKRHAGADMIDRLWEQLLDQSLGAGRAQSRKAILGEVERWCRERERGEDILAEFHSLATA